MDYTAATSFLMQSDPVLATVIEQVGACQLRLDDGDLLYCLSETIIYQQLSGKAAASIHRKFLQLYPDKPFPTAADIVNTPDETLRSAGLSRAKVLYLKDLAAKVQAGFPTIADLELLDDEAIIQQLIAIKGIGRWSAQMLLIFRLNRLDVLPVDDLGVRSAIQKLYQLDALPNKKMIETLGQKWRPYCSISAWYLWRSLDIKTPL
jgi:DNA-3-methyladenine glycosylase II